MGITDTEGIINLEDVIKKALVGLDGEISFDAVYLFGSYLEGKTHKWSDVDLAVYTDAVVGLKMQECARLWSRLQIAVGDWPIELHLYPTSELENPDPRTFPGWVALNGKRVG